MLVYHFKENSLPAVFSEKGQEKVQVLGPRLSSATSSGVLPRAGEGQVVPQVKGGLTLFRREGG